MTAAIRQSVFLLAAAALLGFSRPFLPRGISYFATWPTDATSAGDAYAMMAQAGDPPFISLQTAIEVHEKGKAVFLDARAHDDFVKGRIPGARSLPYYDLKTYHTSALAGLKAGSPIVVYCEGVGCELSFFLARELQEAGYTNIHVFYGGYPEWNKAGLPIEKG